MKDSYWEKKSKLIGKRGRMALGIGGTKWQAVLEASFDILWPIGNARCHHATVDILKWFGIGPVVFNIVDLKLDVGWHARMMPTPY